MPNASYLRVTKSETRDLADRAYRDLLTGKSVEWARGSSSFFAAFVVIAAVVTVLALVVR